MEKRGLRAGTYPVIPRSLTYPDMLECGSPKVNGDVRSENGLSSRGLEKEVALVMGEREKEANIPLSGL